MKETINTSGFELSVDSMPVPYRESKSTELLELQVEELRRQTNSLHRHAKKQDLRLPEPELKEALKTSEQSYKRYKRISKDEDKRGATPEAGLLEPPSTGALKEAKQAYENLAELLISSSPEENRACWMDRRSIVYSGPGKLSKEIEALARAGVDTIYFECDNGGYASYNSKLLQKNPDLEQWHNWDPLKEAIGAAHANGMKIHAWTKVVSVCNRALDDIFRAKYPERYFPPAGPVLSMHEKNTEEDPHGDWALRMPDGSLPSRGKDLFVDPANPKAREFIQNMMLEIANDYPDLDGIQYDYIRYPFQNEELGLNSYNWNLFQNRFPDHAQKTMPEAPSKMSRAVRKDWEQFKAEQIDSFVKDTSMKMKQINPDLDISAAVFPCDLNEAVRQHWDKWLKNGSVKTLNPMTYVPHDHTSVDAEFSPAFEKKFRTDIREILHEAKAEAVLPGIAVSRVNPEGMIKEIEIVKEMKLPGETLFASSVLDSRRLKELELYDSRTNFETAAALIEISIPMRPRVSSAGEDLPEMQIIKSTKEIARLFSTTKNHGTKPELELDTLSSRMQNLQSLLSDYFKKHPERKNTLTAEIDRRIQISIQLLDSASSSKEALLPQLDLEIENEIENKSKWLDFEP